MPRYPTLTFGEIKHLLSEHKDHFHEEKNELLKTGLTVSGYVAQMGNEHFAWFESTGSKSRIHFLDLLRAGDQGYRLNEEARAYWLDNTFIGSGTEIFIDPFFNASAAVDSPLQAPLLLLY